MSDNVNAMRMSKAIRDDRERDIWNEAIEAAAQRAEFEGTFVGTVKKIRELKK